MELHLQAAWTAAVVALVQGLGQQASQPDLDQQSWVGPAPPDCPHPVSPGRVKKSIQEKKRQLYSIGRHDGSVCTQKQPETGRDETASAGYKGSQDQSYGADSYMAVHTM